MSCCISPGAMRNGRGQESTEARIRRIRKCVENAVLIRWPSPNVDICPPPQHLLPNPIVQLPTTLNSRSHTLAKAIASPLRFTQPNVIIGKSPTCLEPLPPFADATEPPQGPGVREVVRQFTNIRGIEDISKPATGALRSSSSRTSQLRTSINAQTNNSRYPLTVIPLIPYPDMPAWRTKPEPGVPIARICLLQNP